MCLQVITLDRKITRRPYSLRCHCSIQQNFPQGSPALPSLGQAQPLGFGQSCWHGSRPTATCAPRWSLAVDDLHHLLFTLPVLHQEGCKAACALLTWFVLSAHDAIFNMTLNLEPFSYSTDKKVWAWMSMNFKCFHTDGNAVRNSIPFFHTPRRKYKCQINWRFSSEEKKNAKKLETRA